MCQCTFPRHPGRVEVMVMVPGFMEILMGISWGYWDFFRDSWDNNPEYLWDQDRGFFSDQLVGAKSRKNCTAMFHSQPTKSKWDIEFIARQLNYIMFITHLRFLGCTSLRRFRPRVSARCFPSDISQSNVQPLETMIQELGGFVVCSNRFPEDGST